MTPSETSRYFQDAVEHKDTWIILSDFEQGISDMQFIAEAAICLGIHPDEMLYNRVSFLPQKVPIATNVAWLSIPKRLLPFEELRDALIDGHMPYKALREDSVFVVLTDNAAGPATTFVTSAVFNKLVQQNSELN